MCQERRRNFQGSDRTKISPQRVSANDQYRNRQSARKQRWRVTAGIEAAMVAMRAFADSQSWPASRCWSSDGGFTALSACT